VRSAEELRARWLDYIAQTMKRTAMYAATGGEMQLLARQLLMDLCFLDDRRVLCYVPSDSAAGWLFIDCHAEHVPRFDVGCGRYTAVDGSELLVRSVRLSGQDFESGLILTLYGKTLRWGTGWWIDHAGQDQPADKDAIASQLREIRDADPSQSLRRPGN
jgi:hypothetical protein